MRLNKFLALEEFPHLKRSVIELKNTNELRKVFGWRLKPLLDDDTVYEFRFIEDVNERRVRDAESLATVIRNTKPAVCLDIGTGLGYSAALMAMNAPEAQIFTINIPAEELAHGEGGVFTTGVIDRDQIGSYYRGRGLTNIIQILANTAHWQPNIGAIDVAFIDGCHDTKFVYNDSIKVLKHAKPGAFLLWHDFNLDLVDKYEWIRSVCLGVEALFARRFLKGRVFHVRDSWVGVYRLE
ncbi:MAG: class I SAM-dependent methyltransferase [Anaerolineales bacterium]|nr:class I SAM-dependent methyltransferase [Anaerolineales bacterium]